MPTCKARTKGKDLSINAAPEQSRGNSSEGSTQLPLTPELLFQQADPRLHGCPTSGLAFSTGNQTPGRWGRRCRACGCTKSPGFNALQWAGSPTVLTFTKSRVTSCGRSPDSHPVEVTMKPGLCSGLCSARCVRTQSLLQGLQGTRKKEMPSLGAETAWKSPGSPRG